LPKGGRSGAARKKGKTSNHTAEGGRIFFTAYTEKDSCSDGFCIFHFHMTPKEQIAKMECQKN